MENILVLSPEMLNQYHRDGYTVVPGFLTETEIEKLDGACARLVSEMDLGKHPATTFSTTDPLQARSEYFIESGDKVRYFFEEEAVDEMGHLKVPRSVALNKMGHALHWHVPEFRSVSFSNKVKRLARQLNFVSPALVQSMYIFKQPGYGGEVVPHRDATFLWTEPQSCVGLWFALEDATVDNGCLWFRPGSHRGNTERRFVRARTADGCLTTKYTGTPDEDSPEEYVAAPVSKGSAVVIDGSVQHRSARNVSQVSRHAYTFHIVERHNTVWAEDNWLQPTKALPFTGLYEN